MLYRKEGTVFPGDMADTRLSTFAASYANDQKDLIATDPIPVYNLPPNMPLYDANGKYYG
jgi:hypothetical protein